MTCDGDNGTIMNCVSPWISGGVNSSIDLSCINGPGHCWDVEVHGAANSSINVMCSTLDSDSSPWIIAQCID